MPLQQTLREPQDVEEGEVADAGDTILALPEESHNLEARMARNLLNGRKRGDGRA